MCFSEIMNIQRNASGQVEAPAAKTVRTSFLSFILPACVMMKLRNPYHTAAICQNLNRP